MDVRPIRTAADHRAALGEIASLMNAEKNTPAGDRLDVLATLVEAYEAADIPIGDPDPISAILVMLEQKQLSRPRAGNLQPGTSGRSAQPATGADAADDSPIKGLSQYPSCRTRPALQGDATRVAAASEAEAGHIAAATPYSRSVMDLAATTCVDYRLYRVITKCG